jgi:uncharacterized delta-60 repeat protein
MLLVVLCLLSAAPAASADDVLPLNASDYDLTFGAAGRVLGTPDGTIRDVAQDGADRIVAVGWAGDPKQLALFRHLPDGLPDPTFGVAGRVVVPAATGLALALQDDGRIVAAGGVAHEGRSHTAVWRFTPAGAPDPSFGSGGRVKVVPPDAHTSSPADVVVDPAGRLLVSVSAWRDGGEGRRALVLRFDADGTPDETFADGGTLELGPGFAKSLAVAPDGDILVAHDTQGVNAFEATRLNEDGSLDEGFGDEGRAVVPRPAPESDVYEPGTSGLLLLDDGDVLLTGASAAPGHVRGWPTGGVLTVVRLDAAGEPVAGFGDAGIASLPADPEHRTWAEPVSVAEDAEGRFVVAGTVSGHVVVGRLLADGAVDEDFGDRGVKRREFVGTGADSNQNNILGGMLLRDDGRILLGGLGGSYDACCSPALMQLRGSEDPYTLLPELPGLEVVTSTVKFVLAAVGAGDLFECRLDGGEWAPCKAVVELTGLANGRHVFEARALLPDGTRAVPARHEFTVAVPHVEPPPVEPPPVEPPPVEPPIELPPVGPPAVGVPPVGVPPVAAPPVAASLPRPATAPSTRQSRPTSAAARRRAACRAARRLRAGQRARSSRSRRCAALLRRRGA